MLVEILGGANSLVFQEVRQNAHLEIMRNIY